MPVASTCSLYAGTVVVQTVDNSKLAVAGTDVAVPVEPFAECVAAGTAALVAVPVESFAAECVAAVVAETSAPSERVVPQSLFFQKHNPLVALLLKPEPVPK